MGIGVCLRIGDFRMPFLLQTLTFLWFFVINDNKMIIFCSCSNNFIMIFYYFCPEIKENQK